MFDLERQQSDSESEDDVEVLDDEDEVKRQDYDDEYTGAKRAIKDRKGVFTERDANVFLQKYGHLAEDVTDAHKSPNLLHAIVELLQGNDIPKLEDVLPLVKRLVRGYPPLLYTLDDQGQNPVFFALKKKQSALVVQMTKYCDEKDTLRSCLAIALEQPYRAEKNKTCLHLALETATKVRTSLVIKWVRLASATALKATDNDNKTPLHYAVNYSSCTKSRVKIIEAFIERDNEAVLEHRKTSPNRPLETFLDVKVDVNDPKKFQWSAYQEHIATAEVYKKTLERMKTRESAAEGHSKRVVEEGKNRNAALPTRSEHENALRQNDPAKLRAPRDFKALEREELVKGRERNKEKATDDSMDQRERMRRQLKEEEERRMRDEKSMPPPEPRRKVQEVNGRRDQSRDRVNLAPETARQAPLRLQTVTAIAAVGRPGGEPAPNTPIKRVPTMPAQQEAPGKSTGPRTTTEKAQLLAKNSEKVINLLKLHYMRTRDIQKATSWLYGTNPRDIQIFFDYKGLPSDVPGELIKKTFISMQFDEVLKYVRFTKVTVRRRPKPRDKAKEPGAEPGRRDMEFFFDWLYNKGVRHILKLTVEENGGAVHSDEAIKTALDRVVVEHLDWQKVDMDPEVICGISGQAKIKSAEDEENPIIIEDIQQETSKNKLKVLDLRWSGNNAVLRAWSEPQGLPLLQELQTVNIIVPDHVVLFDSEEWIDRRINEFKIRLNTNINRNIVERVNKLNEALAAKNLPPVAPSERHVSVFAHGISRSKKLEVAAAGLSGTQSLPMTPADKVFTSHEWMECMERFAQKIKPFWEDMLARWRAGLGDGQGDGAVLAHTAIEDDLVVALIDDGVVSLNEYFAGRVLEGKTFDYHDGVVGQYYNSDQGHGTEMAKLILRVCPMAKIYPIRLKTYLSEDGESKIDLESAALAINAAREKNAKIISMSWSIPVPIDDRGGAKQLFQDAISKAIQDKRLMFCSSPDKGQFKFQAYPSAVSQGNGLFRIGAAHDDGTSSSRSDAEVNYTFPGVRVNTYTAADRRGPQREISGSSVATALAAGLAATIIYCFKASALATKIARSQKNPQYAIPSTQFNEEHVRSIAEHSAMVSAFNNIGFINKARFIQVWDSFEPVSQVLDDPNKKYEDKVEQIVKLCTSLMNWRPGVEQ